MERLHVLQKVKLCNFVGLLCSSLNNRRIIRFFGVGFMGLWQLLIQSVGDHRWWLCSFCFFSGWSSSFTKWLVPPILTERGKLQVKNHPWPNVDAHSGVLLNYYRLTQGKIIVKSNLFFVRSVLEVLVLQNLVSTWATITMSLMNAMTKLQSVEIYTMEGKSFSSVGLACSLLRLKR
ncbi:PREDICTED: uncharacterized protein LOC104762114 [Camelina sativa]|uniref:Uncharacterized protein LOC104762114 n=1 Tax=Camelina sativa TaxID=90675 RepID=A0ABM1RIH9_CAMSA|nr:PREDICTED: uncharacterized protein LOC104762114 [Camelina sativa]